MNTISLHEKGEQEGPRRAFLVGVHLPEMELQKTEELLAELAELVATLDMHVADTIVARVRTQHSRYLVGTGKASEIVRRAQAAEADVIVFDDPLSPSQQRNWEQLAKLTVTDRQEVILDIFAARAHTKEAVLQVALARATYDLPRLKRRWGHLSRQRGMRGGMGLRGEGEQQIEVDYRLVGRRIAQLKSQLCEIQQQRSVQRQRRLGKPVPTAALIGYTNAGKSSLLNSLTGANVLVENKLFATLDPTARRLLLPNNQELVLCDTVGLIRKLPHLLIESFKATLEETLTADFLLEVIDATSPAIDEHHRTTREVLQEIGGDSKPAIIVFNKVDLVRDRLLLRRLRSHYFDAVFVSARTGVGLADLRERLSQELDRNLKAVKLLVPHDRYDVIAKLHRTSHITSEHHVANGVEIAAAVPSGVFHCVEEFLQTNLP